MAKRAKERRGVAGKAPDSETSQQGTKSESRPWAQEPQEVPGVGATGEGMRWGLERGMAGS